MMRKYIYAVGAAVLALAMSGVAAVAAHAEDGFGDSVSGAVRVNLNTDTEVGATSASTSMSVRAGEGEGSSEDRTGTTNVSGRAVVGLSDDFELEDATPPASSFAELKQTIEARKLQLDQEAAATTSEDQGIAKNDNPVRLAVHALLASKTLLGGIGPQVSQIAKDMNDSIATTTSAEAEIQSRGFFTRLFFGGDSAAANVISQEVAQNEQRINVLTNLLNQANVSADVQATLKVQIADIQTAQVRLQALAQSEQGQWGLFSWRF
ncbi:MAG: TrbJ/VirB5 family protein [Minisyncoccota bacterium]